MPEHNRRWEDVERAAGAAARQEVAPFRLLLDQTVADVRDLKDTVFGNPVTRQRGMVDRLEQIEERIAQLGEKLGGQIATVIDEGKARGNQIVGARKAFYILALVITLIGGLPAVAVFLKAIGIVP